MVPVVALAAKQVLPPPFSGELANIFGKLQARGMAHTRRFEPCTGAKFNYAQFDGALYASHKVPFAKLPPRLLADKYELHDYFASASSPK